MFHLFFKQIKLILILPLLLSFNIKSFSQQPYTIAELDSIVNEKYSFDQVLINGVLFADLYRNAIGHPYFLKNSYSSGTILLHNRKFINLSLKYNVYDQNLQLYYEDHKGNQVQILPPVNYISEFSINDIYFRKYNLPKHGEQFCQIIKEGKISCIYYCFKTREESLHEGRYSSYKFSDEETNKYLILENRIYKFNGNYSYLKIIPEQHRKEINNYIRVNQIRLRKANVQVIQRLFQKTEEILYRTIQL